MSTEAARIRAVRDALNQAIVERSTAAFARVWLPDVHITAGSGEVLSNDRARHVKRFVAMFADPSFRGGHRETTSIEIGEQGGLAAEHGQWTWSYGDTGAVVSSHGTYLVMWRNVGGEWRIQSELYIMLRATTTSSG